MRKPILIDVSLTGGRGPAKKTYELISDLIEENIPYVVLTDRGFAQKLTDLGIKPDYIANTSLNDSPKKIIREFSKTVAQIDYLFMVRMGARVAGPIASRKRQKPYIIVDGGLPDYLSNTENLYEGKTFKAAEKFYVTTQFNWKLPKRVDLPNAEICNYPVSQRTFKVIDDLKRKSKIDIIRDVKDSLSGELPNNNKGLLLNLVMTGDYFNIKNRVTYGAWLTAQQYDQCVGFVRRFVSDVGEYYKKTIYIFMDIELKQIVQDLETRYPNIKIITFKTWSFQAELYMKAAADATISRATNYQPYIAALEKGCNITTPVPANGYMDEDTAAVQYRRKGLTFLIPYDDENYIRKLFNFISDEKEQEKIKTNLRKNNALMKQKNLIKLIIDCYKRSTQERSIT